MGNWVFLTDHQASFQALRGKRVNLAYS